MKLLCFILWPLLMCSAAYAQSSEGLKLDQVQIIGSHNSYKKPLDPRVMKFLMKQRKRLGKNMDPIGLDYGHTTIDSQFDYHMRGLEIDIYNDPKGGVFYKRRINAFVHGLPQRSGIEALRRPGFKVLHIKDVDYQTHYYTFIDALAAIKKWSDEHPGHLPLFINIETKTQGPGDVSGFLRFLGFKRTVPYDAAACDSIDAEVKAVYGSQLHGVLTPDSLRGHYATLDDMATHHGWPLLDQCRGKVIFIMLGDAKDLYMQGHPSMTGRAMFAYRGLGTPESAFIMQDDPVRDSASIPELVKKGYIVRTRSDEETIQSRTNDSTRKLAAIKSGAQIISTDYYRPDLRFSTFEVQWDGIHAGRVDPVSCPDRGGAWLKE